VITEIEIANFKSVQAAKFGLGRFNVLIGENGCGKSNLLEAVGFAGAALGDKASHEFLKSRGIRGTEPKLMRSAFEAEAAETMTFKVGDRDSDDEIAVEMMVDASTSQWKTSYEVLLETHYRRIERDFFRSNFTESDDFAGIFLPPPSDQKLPRTIRVTGKHLDIHPDTGDSLANRLHSFIIYSPENTALRTFQSEGQILPLGVAGEGLFAHVRTLFSDPAYTQQRDDLCKHLKLLDWLGDVQIPELLGLGERRLAITDRHLADGTVLDQRSVNEGFLFLLFYFTLFVSPQTPAFFAIDNIDASLNPRLCSHLVQVLVELATKYDKQVVVTTHNPAILDGLNLDDDNQRLLVVSRTSTGRTRLRRVKAPRPVADEPPIRLSEAFVRGYLGGLPKYF